MKISEAIVRSTKSRKLCNIFFGCTAATSSMKQQAPKTLPQKAETIENTRKTADILIGAACHLVEPKKISTRKTQKFQLFHPIGTQCVMGVQLVRAKARRKLMHLSLRLAFLHKDRA